MKNKFYHHIILYKAIKINTIIKENNKKKFKDFITDLNCQ